MSETARPIVVVSRCLDLEACRYDGQVIPNAFIRRLAAHVTLIPVCPEVQIGLGVPREPIRLIRQGEDVRAIQAATGQDVTERLVGFAQRFLDALPEVDGFILKSRSPSCGIRDTKIFPSAESEVAHGRGAGLFAEMVIRRFSGLAIEDEGRLNDEAIRDHFLTKLFTFARFRQATKAASIAALVHFHATHKFLLMAHSQKELRAMGRLVANAAHRPLSDVLAEYRHHLQQALQRAARRPALVNVFQHGFGYVSKHLTAREKALFQQTLEKYRRGRVPVSAVLSLLRAWIVRFESDYLLAQTFFEPYPDDLREPLDPRVAWELGIPLARNRRRTLA
ncbi:MAG: DUF523 and DUF1722 domain-containing protein [Acidobacteriota bacterium]|nr:DUF523 and DUF1722 domain-containing protein [Acidobacteriota bacterium]